MGRHRGRSSRFRRKRRGLRGISKLFRRHRRRM